MPIYEYQCASCGKLVEVLVRSHTSVPACPNCGSLLAGGRRFSAPHVMSDEARRPAGRTCCGREERCSTPACSGGGTCRHD